MDGVIGHSSLALFLGDVVIILSNLVFLNSHNLASAEDFRPFGGRREIRFVPDVPLRLRLLVFF
jgi:hypothetical protein